MVFNNASSTVLPIRFESSDIHANHHHGESEALVECRQFLEIGPVFRGGRPTRQGTTHCHLPIDLIPWSWMRMSRISLMLMMLHQPLNEPEDGEKDDDEDPEEDPREEPCDQRPTKDTESVMMITDEACTRPPRMYEQLTIPQEALPHQERILSWVLHTEGLAPPGCAVGRLRQVLFVSSVKTARTIAFRVADRAEDALVIYLHPELLARLETQQTHMHECMDWNAESRGMNQADRSCVPQVLEARAGLDTGGGCPGRSIGHLTKYSNSRMKPPESQSLGGGIRRPVQPVRVCFYPDFMKCQPLNFKGTEGVVGLSQWIKKMESVFHISGCAIKNQVKFATCTLLGVALTWWNGHVRTLGHDAAYAMTWGLFKQQIDGQSCPNSGNRNLTLNCGILRSQGETIVCTYLHYSVS
ncbi:hypothetical protein Tco_0174292 [Tanacetum coccineum]